MRRIIKVVLVATFVNFLILVASIRLFHDRTSLYHLINIGDKFPETAYLDRDMRITCSESNTANTPRQSPTSTERGFGDCVFHDFWQTYWFSYKDGIVVRKHYESNTDILTSFPVPYSRAWWLLCGFSVVLVLGGWLWMRYATPSG